MIMISHHAQDAVSTSIDSFELTVFCYRRFSCMKCYGQYSFLRVLFLKYLLPVFILFCVFEVVQAQSWIYKRPLIYCNLHSIPSYKIQDPLLVFNSIISPQMFHKHLMVWNFAEKRVD